MVLLQNHFFNYLGIVAASNRPGDVEAYFGTNFLKKTDDFRSIQARTRDK